MPRLTRALAAAALAATALGLVPVQAATAAPECTEVHPCYQCVMYPCYPSDWPPFLIDKVQEIVDGLR